METYTALANKGQQFEVVFVSSDRDTDQFSVRLKTPALLVIHYQYIRYCTASILQQRMLASPMQGTV